MIWRSGRRDPVTVTNTVPPRDIIPLDTPETAQVEVRARIKHAAALVERVLRAESVKIPGLRDPELIDLCLEVRSALRPSAPGSEVLREPPVPLPVRYAVPVAPGRAS